MATTRQSMVLATPRVVCAEMVIASPTLTLSFLGLRVEQQNGVRLRELVDIAALDAQHRLEARLRVRCRCRRCRPARAEVSLTTLPQPRPRSTVKSSSGSTFFTVSLTFS